MAKPESREQLDTHYEPPAISSLGSTDRLTAMPVGSITFDGNPG
jgi:hypothetical protein